MKVDFVGGAKAKIKLFPEYGRVTYQIKADDACRDMVANILPTDTPLTLGEGQKVKFFCPPAFSKKNERT